MQLPFKTSVITDEIAQDVVIAVDVAKEYGLDGIEIRGAWGKGPHDLTTDDTARINDLAGAANLAVCAVAPPFFKCELTDKEAVAQHLDILRRSCATAHALNAGIVRGFAFWRRGPLEDVKTDIARHLEDAARIVHGEGLILGLENEYSTGNNNVARTLELIEAVGSPSMKLLYDPGNDVHDEEGEAAWPDSYNLAKDAMVHVHLKDPKRDPATGEVTARPIGEGDIHARELLSAIVRDGYTGFISLETHYRREPLGAEITRLPQGEGFSAGGYTATRECLDHWFAIMADIVNAPGGNSVR